MWKKISLPQMNEFIIYCKTEEQLNILYNSMPNLIELGLIANKFIEIPNQIFQLYKVKVLYLSNNKIYEIPDEISNLKNLEELYIGENNLTKISLEFIKLKKMKIFLSIGNPIDEEYLNNLMSLLGL